jgi:HAD superfamily hydrolase (TIGR01549 family)
VSPLPHGVRAVLLDAYGTIVTLEPPAPALTRMLIEEGFPHPEPAVARAIRAEILFYRANHDLGRDAASLADLRRRCAAVVARHLGGPLPPLDRLAELLVASLRFVLLPDALPALDALAAAGMRLAVVSNWDCSLPEELARLGIAHRFEVTGVSAIVGARKPGPGLFHHVLGELGLPAGAVIHCGDRPDMDCLGARQAGVAAVLVDRDGALEDGPCPRIGSLLELPALLAGGAATS